MQNGLRGAVLLLASLSSAATAARYGETLLAARIKHDPQLIHAAIDTKSETPLHFEAGNDQAAASHVTVEVKDALGDTAGTLTLAYKGGLAPGVAQRRADAVAEFLSRRFYAPAVLAEPDPLVPGARRSRLGQALVERQLAVQPALVTIAFHVALRGRPNAIVASNFGRIGKAADKDDAKVIDNGAILQELTNGGRRLAVELPMLDRRGRVIGALSTSFLLGAGGRAAAYDSALKVRGEVARAIASLDRLEDSLGEEE